MSDYWSGVTNPRDRAAVRGSTLPIVQALDVFDAALDVVRSWLDVRGAGADAVGAHDVAVRALGDALVAAGVLDREVGLDPAAVLRLSPPATGAARGSP